MSENKPSLYWHGGKEGAPLTGQICAREGKSGRDADPQGWGRVSFFPYNWPNTITQDNSLLAHVMTQSPQGPFGETVHHDLLDGLRVACTLMPDGTPLIHTIWSTWTGGETTGTSGAQGETTYVGAHVKEGR